ncbi:MAG: class I SAM-dependent methyltransferase [Bacteroidales bacterium]|nr:class I SAM-dependent methyltransferase [Bacteroidales bacterium]MBN2756365.1 class I SAM-dependent methyltransferase [Bacteroidales bacterium]
MESRFDKIAKEWDSSQRRINIAANVLAEIKKQIPLSENMEVLDYGTGTGLILLGLQAYVKNFTGMDNSEGMLNVLKEKVDSLGNKNIFLLKHNVDNEDLPLNKFDLIVINMALHHIKDTNRFIKKAYESLKPEGYLCITDLVKEDGTFHDNADLGVHHLGFDIEDLNKILINNNFKVKTLNQFYSIDKPREDGVKKFPMFIAVGIK